DSYPADVTIKATLLDAKGNELTSYYDQYNMTHKLMSKEETGFRIDFEGVDWNEKPTHERVEPSSFIVEVLGSVANQDLYKKIAFQNIEVKNNTLRASLYNQGNRSTTISQFIISHFKDDELVWVDTHFSDGAIFPKKSTPVSFTLSPLQGVEIIPTEDDIILINGLENKLIANKYESRSQMNTNVAIALSDSTFIQMQLNNFVANPTPF
ncbi:MAG: hypothetical protein AB8B73_07195, partial [Ekhidna sp.]